MRKLTTQTIRPVWRHCQGVNSGYYKYYHFTLDTYDGHNSFQGGTAYDLDGCYSYDGRPFDAYALDLETGDVLDLETKQTIMRVNLKTGDATRDK